MLKSGVSAFKELSLLAKVITAALIIGIPVMFVSAISQPQQSVAPQTQPVQKKEPTITNKEITEEQDIDFTKKTEETDALSKGVTQLKTTGVKGKKTLTYKLTLTDGVETKRELVGEVVTSEPIDEVTLVGTYVAPAKPACNPNYSGCVPNVSYDLDCPDIGYSVRVLGYDQYRLDADHDGWGCDSY